MKGVAEDNSLMAEVVDDVEIGMGLFQRRIEFLLLIFLMNASFGWIQCKCRARNTLKKFISNKNLLIHIYFVACIVNLKLYRSYICAWY